MNNPPSVKTVVAPVSAIERAFAQWDADYRKDPKAFADRAQVDGLTPETYGQWAAATLLKYLPPHEQAAVSSGTPVWVK